MSVSDGALVDSHGHLAAICTSGNVSFNDARLIASSETEGAFASENSGDIAYSFLNSSIDLSGAQGHESFPQNAIVSLKGSWAELPAGSSIGGSVTDGNGESNAAEPVANKDAAKSQLSATGDANSIALALVVALVGAIILIGGAIAPKVKQP